MLPFFSKAQYLHKSQPKINSSILVADFMKENKVTSHESNYIILLPPGSCPRCEALLNPLIKRLSKLDTIRNYNIVVDYPSIKSAKNHLIKNGIDTSRVIYDTKTEFFGMFVNNANPLSIPWLYKFDSKWNMIISIPFLGMQLNDSLITNIKKANELKTIVSDNESPIQKNNSITQNNLAFETKEFKSKILLESDDNLNIYPSLAQDIKFDPFSKRYLWIDYLMDSPIIYSERGEFSSKIQKSEIEFTFLKDSRIPIELFDFLKDNVLKVVYLKIFSFEKERIEIIASLPRVDMLIENTDTTVDYSNSICMLTKVNGETQINEVKLEESLEDMGLFTKHEQAVKIDSLIYFPLFKGWPIKGTLEFNIKSEDSSYNPILDSFYNFSPLFSIYNTNTKQSKVVGKLPREFVELKCGYYNYKPKICKWNNQLIFSDGFNDYLSIRDKNFNEIDKLQLGFPFVNKQQVNRIRLTKGFKLKDPLAYLQQTQRDLSIYEMAAKNDTLFILYSVRSLGMFFSKYNLKTKQMIETMLVEEDPIKIQQFKFINKENEVNLIKIGLDNNQMPVIYL